jgi:hypothetical protein
MSTHTIHSTSQRCEEEMRKTSPSTRNLFPAGDPARAAAEPSARKTCTADLFLLGAAATQPIGR